MQRRRRSAQQHKQRQPAATTTSSRQSPRPRVLHCSLGALDFTPPAPTLGSSSRAASGLSREPSRIALVLARDVGPHVRGPTPAQHVATRDTSDDRVQLELFCTCHRRGDVLPSLFERPSFEARFKDRRPALSSHFSGFCMPFVAMNFNVSVDVILSFLIGTSTLPLTLTTRPDALEFDEQTRRHAFRRIQLEIRLFRGFVFPADDTFEFVRHQFARARARGLARRSSDLQPVNFTTTPASSLLLPGTNWPLLVSFWHSTPAPETFVRTPTPPEVVNLVFSAPGTQSYFPVFVPLTFVHLASVKPPLYVFPIFSAFKHLPYSGAVADALAATTALNANTTTRHRPSDPDPFHPSHSPSWSILNGPAMGDI